MTMSLVQYSDSESDSQLSDSPPPAKKPCRNTQPSGLPPLPATFRDLYATNSRVSVQDDPSLHGGRKRAIPHVEGNWPSHIYLEWYPSKADLSVLQNLISKVSSGSRKSLEIKSLLHSDLGAQLPLHISLSRSLVLRTEERTSFIEVLKGRIKDSRIMPFQAKPDTLKWVSNYEKTRWFLVLHVAKPAEDSLNRLLKLFNDAVAKFNQPTLYTNSHQGSKQSQVDFSDYFHISIAWSLSEPTESDNEFIRNIDIQQVRQLSVNFNCIKAKVGNNVTSMPLPEPA